MSDNSFNLKVYSPSGLVFEEKVFSVVLPGEDGEVGVLPMHARYVGTLGTGVMFFEPTMGGEKGQVVISGGFARMKDGELSILADSVVLPDEAEDLFSIDEKQHLEDYLKNADAHSSEWLPAKTRLQKMQAIEQIIKTK